MARIVTLTTIAVAAALLAPAAGATWSSFGAWEPDTPWDTPSLMWQNAPGAIKNRVYFNAFIQYVEGGPNGGVINPNTGTLQSRMDPVGERAHEALFGVWTDCNLDGYIGMAETAVREYHAALLPANHICPAATGSIGAPWPGANNYNSWVSELIPIGNADTTNADKRIWKDPAAMVWGDPGEPNDAAAQVEEGCGTFPMRGHGHYVGGFVQALDCDGRRTVAGEPLSIVALWDTALGGAGLAWGSDPEHSSSPANVHFGEEDSDNSAVVLQDCSQEPILATDESAPGTDADNIVILRPVPANPVNSDVNSWTVPGTFNATFETIGVLHPHMDTENDAGPTRTANCDYTDDSGGDFYRQVEANPAASAVDGKNRATWNFDFSTATRGSLPANFVGAGAAGVPTDFGIEPTTYQCSASSCMQSFWTAGFGTAIYTPPVTRGDAVAGTIEIAHAPRYSYYAALGATTLARGFVTPGGSGKYGSGQCGINTAGEHNGWNCNAAEWYLLADGTPDEEPVGIGIWARVGQVYQFRDVDCYDGNTGLGIGISPAFYGARPC